MLQTIYPYPKLYFQAVHIHFLSKLKKFLNLQFLLLFRFLFFLASARKGKKVLFYGSTGNTVSIFRRRNPKENSPIGHTINSKRRESRKSLSSVFVFSAVEIASRIGTRFPDEPKNRRTWNSIPCGSANTRYQQKMVHQVRILWKNGYRNNVEWGWEH